MKSFIKANFAVALGGIAITIFDGVIGAPVPTGWRSWAHTGFVFVFFVATWMILTRGDRFCRRCGMEAKT